MTWWLQVYSRSFKFILGSVLTLLKLTSSNLGYGEFLFESYKFVLESVLTLLNLIFSNLRYGNLKQGLDSFNLVVKILAKDLKILIEDSKPWETLELQDEMSVFSGRYQHIYLKIKIQAYEDQDTSMIPTYISEDQDTSICIWRSWLKTRNIGVSRQDERIFRMIQAYVLSL